MIRFSVMGGGVSSFCNRAISQLEPYVKVSCGKDSSVVAFMVTASAASAGVITAGRGEVGHA